MNNCTGVPGEEFTWVRDPRTGLEEFWMGDHRMTEEELQIPQNKSGCQVVEELPDNLLGSGRDLDAGREFVGVLIVTDNLRLEALGGDKVRLKASTVNVVSMLQDIYEDLEEPGPYQVRIELDQVANHQGDLDLPWELAFRSGNYFGPESMLIMFASWARDKGYLKRFNTVILLTGPQLLQGSTIGIASLGTYCRGGVAIVESLSSDPGTAKTMAHELGHTLGIRHTSSYMAGTSLDTAEKVLPCLKQTTSVMSAMIMSTSYVWDSCSVEWFRLYMQGYPYGCGQPRLGSPPCTYWPGYQPGCMDSRNPTCGNTIVDPGEQCDCGSESECTDPCCNPKTCQLRGSCSTSESPCCDPQTCEPFRASQEHLCQPATEDSCSEDSYCLGGLECPRAVSRNFESCELLDEEGHCYNGQCVSHAISCQTVKKTMGGSQVVGPCIRAIYGDVACKDLYCEYGIYGYCTSFNTPSRLQVSPGSSCGTGSVCLEQKCVPVPGLDTASPTTQPTKQPTYKPTRHPGSKATRRPSRYRRRCVWRNQKRVCRWKRGQKPPTPVT